MDPANPNGFPTGGAPAPEAVAEPAPDTTPETNPETNPDPAAVTPEDAEASPETKPEPEPDAKPVDEPAADAPKATAEEIVREQLAAAGYDADEFLAPQRELSAEQESWGTQWPVRDLHRAAGVALVTQSTNEWLSAAEQVSPRIYEHVFNILESNAGDHLAYANGISPDELARRIGPLAEVEIPRTLERAFDQLGEEDQKAFAALVSANDEKSKRLADAGRTIKGLQGKIVDIQTSQATTSFATEFTGWHAAAIGRLVDVPADAVESMQIVTTQRFLADPDAQAAIGAYAQAKERGENDRILRATFLPRVHEAVETIVRREAARLGYKLKTDAASAPAKPKASAGTAPKVIAPKKAPDAAAPPTTRETKPDANGANPIPSTEESVERYLASRKKAAEARA